MGRAPCCDKANVKKGPWSPEEDTKLKSYIEHNGTGGNWIALPQKIGLKRCGKSCRLRWLNYLRPNIKHGGFSEDEDRVICSLYGSIGSRWSIIAAQLPGRTDNDIKNYWNTRLKKKLLGKQRNSSNSGRRSKRTLLSEHHHLTNNNTIPQVLPNSTPFNLISNTQLMFPYSWPPIPATVTTSTATTSNPLPSLLMKLEHQNMYYPPLITTNHHQIEDQMANMLDLDGSVPDLGGCLGQAFDATHNLPTFPRELEELMCSTSDPAAQRMGGLDHFLAWDHQDQTAMMINNSIGAVSAGSETSSWCEMSSLISLPMGTGATNSSCNEGILPVQDHGFDHQLRYTGN